MIWPHKHTEKHSHDGHIGRKASPSLCSEIKFSHQQQVHFSITAVCICIRLILQLRGRGNMGRVNRTNQKNNKKNNNIQVVLTENQLRVIGGEFYCWGHHRTTPWGTKQQTFPPRSAAFSHFNNTPAENDRVHRIWAMHALWDFRFPKKKTQQGRFSVDPLCKHLWKTQELESLQITPCSPWTPVFMRLSS